jgi:hypothetical protein
MPCQLENRSKDKLYISYYYYLLLVVVVVAVVVAAAGAGGGPYTYISAHIGFSFSAFHFGFVLKKDLAQLNT